MAFFVICGNSREIASTTSSTDPCTKILSRKNLQEAKSKFIASANFVISRLCFLLNLVTKTLAQSDHDL